MKSALHLISFATLLASQLLFAAPKAQDINLCYFEYREEMTTAALHTADKKGFFAKNGIKVNWIKRSSPSNFKAPKDPTPANKGEALERSLVEELNTGGCDFASSTFESIVAAELPSLEQLVPLAVYRYGKDYDTHLVQRADLNLKSLAELKGKHIRAGSIGVLVVMNEILKSAKLTAKDADLTVVDPPTLAADIDKKKVDVVLAYVPTIPLLIASGRVKILEKNVYSRYLGGLSIPHSMLVANKNFMTQKPELFQKFVAAFKKGADEVSKHPENAIYGEEIVSYPVKIYSKSDIEKSLNFFSVGKPLYYDTAGFFQNAQFAEYQNKIVAGGFIAKAADLTPWQK